MIMRQRQTGLSILEFMIAISIGLVLVAGLVTMFANSSNTEHELRRSSQQIENGRYAMDVLVQDLQLAGYFGSYRKFSAATAAPDICSLTLSDLQTAASVPVQAINAAIGSTATLPSSCDAFIPTENLSAGSDVLVVRRLDTTFVPIGTATTSGLIYAQTNPATLELQPGGGTTTCSSKADGTATTVNRRCNYPTTVDVCSATCPTDPAGYIRQYHVHVYFVSPCNVPASGAKCGADADGGRPIPTLKRLELAVSGGAATFQVAPIAEGVEFLKFGYGIDDVPAAVNLDTGQVGDGTPDRYTLAPTLAELSNVVTVRIDLLVRNPEPSMGYTDTKTYQLGVDPALPTSPAVTIVASSLDTSYRRHVYSAETRLVNLSGRKEIP